MTLEVRIGERRVIGSGHLVLGPEEREATFIVDGVACRLIFTPVSTNGPFQVRFTRHDLQRLDVETTGRFPEGAVSWTYQGLLTQGGQLIDLDLMVFSETGASDSIRRLTYTLSSRPPGAAGLIDPTSPAPTLPRAGDAPPPIAVRWS